MGDAAAISLSVIPHPFGETQGRLDAESIRNTNDESIPLCPCTFLFFSKISMIFLISWRKPSDGIHSLADWRF